MANSEWFDQLLAKIDYGGTLKATAPEVVAYLTANKPAILALGKDAFKSFVALLAEGKAPEALQVVLMGLDAQGLIDRMHADADAITGETERRRVAAASALDFAGKTLAPTVLDTLVLVLLKG